MSFGTELWNQLELVEQYTEDGVVELDKLQTFLKNVLEVEEIYARALHKIGKEVKEDAEKAVRKHKKRAGHKSKEEYNESDVNTVQKTWLTIATYMEHMSDSHQRLVDSLRDDILKSVKAQIKDNEKNRRQHLDDVKKQKVDYKKAVENLDKVKKHWEHAAKESEHATRSFLKAEQNEKVTQQDVEKLRVDHESKLTTLKSAVLSYQQTVDETNTHRRRHFEQDLPNTLNQIQREDEERRVDFTKNVLWKFAKGVEELVPAIHLASQQIVETVDKISPVADSEHFVNSIKKPEDHPQDFICEAEDGSSKVASKKKYLTTEDEISALDYNKGRKRAVARLKELDKYQTEYETKRKVAKNEEQGSEIDRKIKIIRLKKHKLDVYIAKCDNAPEPVLPEDLAGSPDMQMDQETIQFTDRNSFLQTGTAGRISTMSGRVSIISRSDTERKMSVIPDRPPTPPIVNDSKGTCVAMYDFEGQNEGELSVAAGQELEVLEEGADWWRVRVIKNGEIAEGYVPSTYVQ